MKTSTPEMYLLRWNLSINFIYSVANKIKLLLLITTFMSKEKNDVSKNIDMFLKFRKPNSFFVYTDSIWAHTSFRDWLTRHFRVWMWALRMAFWSMMNSPNFLIWGTLIVGKFMISNSINKLWSFQIRYFNRIDMLFIFLVNNLIDLCCIQYLFPKVWGTIRLLRRTCLMLRLCNLFHCVILRWFHISFFFIFYIIALSNLTPYIFRYTFISEYT